MPKVISWRPEEAEQKLRQRLESCQQNRANWEAQWRSNANLVYSAFAKENGSSFSISFDNVIELESGEVDSGDSQISTNYIKRYLEFRHGQLASNPPMAIARPTSSDYDDKLKADAADRLIQHGKRDKRVQEIFDQATKKCLVRGNGWIKLYWDKDQGDIFDHNKETDEVVMKGDIVTYSPATLSIWVDPAAKTAADIRYIFEEHLLPYEDAVFKFPSATKLLQGAIVSSVASSATKTAPKGEEVCRIFEYWEKGTPTNGMAGRHAWMTADGKLLSKMEANPHIHAGLPYHLITDMDVEDEVYGKSSIEFVARQQDVLNQFDSAMVDALQAHGVIRMAVPDSSELNDDEISTSNYDIIKYSGAIPPHFLPAPALPQDMVRLREQLRSDIQEMMGINDAQLGNIKRETSGFSQQTSIESGNVANRRLMNKYTQAVEDFWKDYLGLVRDHWTIPRKILVMGKNKAFEAFHYSGADIAGGYDVSAAYGTSLPLDPNMAREQIMLLMEPMKEAGIPMTRIINMLKLDDIGGVYDELQMGEDRQREIFEEMTALYHAGLGEAYIPPEELENHESYLMFATKFRNSMEFKVLPEEVKALVDRHITERMDMAAAVGAAGSAELAPPPALPELPGIPAL